MPKFKKITFDGSRELRLGKQSCLPDGLIAESKEKWQEAAAADLKDICEYQNKLYAGKTEGVIILLQGMDAAGKDGLISHVMNGVNLQGVDVYSFKQPNPHELLHDYLWRVAPCLPERGKIAIFNRSYYEDVLVVRVHELYRQLGMPPRCTENIFAKRYEQIRNFEKYLWENGIRMVKIFLHLSKDEQKERLLSRIEDKSKNWKFSLDDVQERGYWDAYQTAYEDAINATAAPHAPWYVIPADKKPAARLIAGEIILHTLKSIQPAYPDVSEKMKQELEKCSKQLRST